MRFNVLGPLRVLDEAGEATPITRPRLRNLLTVLLLHANQSVNTSSLSVMLNGDGRITSPNVLRTHITLLRRILEPARRLHTDADGYRIEIYPEELDVERFHHLAKSGRRALDEGSYQIATDLLSQALAIWREPPLADLPIGTETIQHADRLLDERRIVSELLTEARLALGQHRDLLTELWARVKTEPLQEHSWSQLMIALYRSGRRAEAFDAYVQLRTVLSNEYGIDPSKKLQLLYQQILDEDPALDVPT